MGDIKFWTHKITGYTGIQMLFESVFPNSFEVYNEAISRVNPSDINIIVFRWETKNAINPTYNTTTTEFYNFISELNDMGFYFMGDFSTEAEPIGVDSGRVEFIKELLSLGVPLKRIILAQNDSLRLSGYKMNYGGYPLQVIHFPQFLLGTPFYMNLYVTNPLLSSDTHPTKDFLCLNRRVSNHKYKMLKRLWERDLLKDTNWTWVDTLMDKSKINSKFISDLGIDFNKSIQLEGDIMYGRELQYADEYLYTINPNWYYDSKVNIINETHVSNDRIHITEKSWKAIYLGIPFVVCSSNYHLDRMRIFGYKTFNTIIDESYDIKNNMDSIIDSAIKLSKQYNSNEVRDICDYNRDRILDLNSHKWVLENYFIKPLSDIYSKRVII